MKNPLRPIPFSILSAFILSAGILLAPRLALAEIERTGIYAGAHYSDAGYELDPDSGDKVTESWGHVKAKLGKTLNDMFAIEGQLGLTNNTDQDQGVITYGAYLRIGRNFGQYLPYGLIGFSGVEIYGDDFDDQSESGGSYGVGLEIFGSKDLTVTIEYLNLIDKSVDDGDLTLETLGIGFTYYFTEDTSYFNKNRNKIRSIRY